MSPTNDIIKCCKIVLRFCGYILIRFKELEDSCRDVFRDIIYSIRNETEQDQAKGDEVEVIKFGDFIAKIHEIIQPEKLSL